MKTLKWIGLLPASVIAYMIGTFFGFLMLWLGFAALLDTPSSAHEFIIADDFNGLGYFKGISAFITSRGIPMVAYFGTAQLLFKTNPKPAINFLGIALLLFVLATVVIRVLYLDSDYWRAEVITRDILEIFNALVWFRVIKQSDL
jgi:hypothetical protein